VMAIVNKNPSVKGSSPFILDQVVVQTEPESGTKRVQSPYIRGIDPRVAGGMGLFTSNLTSGVSDLSGRGLLVGNDFADRMYLTVVDRVVTSTPADLQKMWESSTNHAREIITPPDYEVRGIFNTGFYEYNSTIVVTSLENTQDLFHLDDSVYGVL